MHTKEEEKANQQQKPSFSNFCLFFCLATLQLCTEKQVLILKTHLTGNG